MRAPSESAFTDYPSPVADLHPPWRVVRAL
jgi:hypothetical protein